ncbi:MAG: hypothetical protein ACN4E2_00530 [Nitrospinota bacterium]
MEICDACNIKIETGHIRYKLEINLYAIDDGLPAENLSDLQLTNLIDSLAQEDSIALEKNIFDKNLFILCSQCKKDFVLNPFKKFK